jgi:glycosyltransferase involved in cell wall biosynthesis
MTLVSVIIPTFNGAATLAEAIGSVRAQDVPVEIIVVDDGSTDETPRLDLGDAIVIRQENRGPAAARNTGLARATAPFIAFLDDDDLWMSGKLRAQLETLAAHPRVLATIGSCTCDLTAPRRPFFLYSLGASLLRREAFDRVGTFDPALPGSEDVDWFFRLRDAGHEPVVTAEIVQVVRRDGGNITLGKDLGELGFHAALQRSLVRRRNRPLVSVIVPVFNGARFLGAALDSIAAQDYVPIEVIVVDDGSTDGSADIARERGVTLVPQANRGPAAARNAGVDRARGDILAFLDQDDVWLPSKIRKQVDALIASPDHVSLVLNQFFLEAGVEVPRWFRRTDLLDVPHPGWAPSCVAFRRATFARVGRFDEGFTRSSDMDWFTRAKENGVAIETIPELLVRRRIHETNDSAEPVAFREILSTLHTSLRRRRGQEQQT